MKSVPFGTSEFWLKPMMHISLDDLFWPRHSAHEEEHSAVVVPDEEDERVVHLEVVLPERAHPFQ